MSEATQSIQLKILHCSDIHLDTPFFGLTGDKSDERRRELRSSFGRVMQYVRDRGVDLCLISGDLFDNDYATNTTAEFLIREFRNCAPTTFIIAPGKNDHYENNPIYTSGRLPANVHVFSSEALSRFDFEDKNVTVYGWGFVTDTMTESPLYERVVDDASRINLVCGYCELGGGIDSTACPVSEQDIKRFGADYYALGSRHDSTEMTRLSNGSTYCYSGALECTGFTEPGMGGVNLITATYEEGQLSIDARSLRFGHLRFITEQMDITGVNSPSEIIARISRYISDKGYGTDTALRIELVGDLTPEFIIPKNLDFDSFGLYFLDVADKTLPLYETEHFLKDMTVAGRVYRSLLPMLTSEDETERLMAARAFRVAYAALTGRDFD